MRTIIKRFAGIYSMLVSLYPFEFRANFGDEMKEVFISLLVEQASSGYLAVWRTFWREVRDWPVAVITEYYSAIRDIFRRGILRLLDEDKFWRIEDRREAFVASLPPLLFGMGIALSALVIWKPWHTIPTWRLMTGAAIVAFSAVIIALGGLWALVKRIPAWGYTWLGSAAMGLVLFIKTVAEEREDFGLPFLSPLMNIVIAILMLVVLAVLLGYSAWRGWRRAGMVSMGFATMAGMSVISLPSAAPFNRYDLALLAVPVGAVMSFLIYKYVRQGDRARILAIAGFGLLNVLALVSTSSVWESWLFDNGRPSPFVPLLVVLVGVLLVGPVAGIIGQPLRRLLRGT